MYLCGSFFFHFLRCFPSVCRVCYLARCSFSNVFLLFLSPPLGRTEAKERLTSYLLALLSILCCPVLFFFCFLFGFPFFTIYFFRDHFPAWCCLLHSVYCYLGQIFCFPFSLLDSYALVLWFHLFFILFRSSYPLVHCYVFESLSLFLSLGHDAFKIYLLFICFVMFLDPSFCISKLCGALFSRSFA